MPPPSPRVNSGGLAERKVPLVPPPRKAVPVDHSIHAMPMENVPTLPPRRPSNPLMDDGQSEMLHAWVPLEPEKQ